MCLGLLIALVCLGRLPAQDATDAKPQASAANSNARQQPPRRRPPNPVFAPVEDVEGLPRVLLIGDSISIGYTLDVRELLKGKANVHRPAANCGPTTAGLKSLDQWLATGGQGKKWDVIHFNWGLHDLKYMGPDGSNLADPKAVGSHQQVPPEEYRKNLRELVKHLKKTGAVLVWRNTTPVPEGAAGRVPGDSARYNEIAAEVMRAESVQIHDLYSFASRHAAEIQLPANVHYSKDGSRRLAEEVAAVIAKALPRP
ncbi:MAG: SGNH/GDSL hydrolase family protein [Pirellulaceae bacterium]|nr:SGNH/GDSL hydrolase family protein [Pirellulaceae bacterium]